MAGGWRRSFGWTPGGTDSNMEQLMLLNAHETIDAVWWSFTFTLVMSGDDLPVGNSPGKAGLIITDATAPEVLDPFTDPAADWLDMQPITWTGSVSQSSVTTWWCHADLGPRGHKAKAKRRLNGREGQALYMSWHIYGNGVPAGWSDQLGMCWTADAYILNIGT